MDAYALHGAALTVQHVVSRAGLSHGTFYNYFDDMDAFIEAIALHVLSGLGASLAACGSDDPARRFAAATLQSLALIAQHPVWARVLLRLISRPALGETLFVHMRADLAAGRALGRFCGDAEELGADLVIGAFVMSLIHISADQWSSERAHRTTQRLLTLLGIAETEASQLVAEEASSRRFP